MVYKLKKKKKKMIERQPGSETTNTMAEKDEAMTYQSPNISMSQTRTQKRVEIIFKT